jgi:hypothetical protein
MASHHHLKHHGAKSEHILPLISREPSWVSDYVFVGLPHRILRFIDDSCHVAEVADPHSISSCFVVSHQGRFEIAVHKASLVQEGDRVDECHHHQKCLVAAIGDLQCLF